MSQGGFRLCITGSNQRRHLSLYITTDQQIGTASELNLIHTTQRLRKAKRVLNRRRKLLHRLEGRSLSLDYLKHHPDYPMKKPHGMSKKRFLRLIRDGYFLSTAAQAQSVS